MARDHGLRLQLVVGGGSWRAECRYTITMGYPLIKLARMAAKLYRQECSQEWGAIPRTTCQSSQISQTGAWNLYLSCAPLWCPAWTFCYQHQNNKNLVSTYLSKSITSKTWLKSKRCSVPTNIAWREWAGEFIGRPVAAHPNVFPHGISVRIGKGWYNPYL